MHKLSLRKTILVGEYEAMEYLECNTFDLQRHLRFEWIDHLVHEIKTGMFHTGSIVMAILLYDSKRVVMVNGQHQCHAVMKSGGTITANYEEWTCENEMDLANMYGRYDVHQIRTVPESLAPTVSALKLDWKPKTVCMIVGAAAMADSRKKGGAKIYTDTRQELIKNNQASGAFINHLIGKRSKLNVHLRRVPVVRAMMDTWAVDKVTALEFWTLVRDGEMIKKGDAVWTLRAHLLGIQSLHSHYYRELYVKCIHAWNAYITKTPTRLKYIENEQIPRIRKRK